ncbi:MAG TPA: arginine--tRNA ligase [Candidatus Paceibacterota bacterium]|nr:arginine--tRNA ligase [Candidatus Paceibacterota bacterium]HMO82778.1 arginine--tRNA ligase [Candidatus Paceibacterota bacterium]
MKEVIKAALQAVLTKLGLPEANFTIEHPADLSHGDYACNVAMVLGKQVGQAPRTVAEQIQEALQGQIEYVAKIEIAGPGFLNFYLSRDFFAAEIARANDLEGEWGSNHSLAEETVLVEYTSPNLFKPLHIGNLVGNIIGESLTRLFECGGADVKRLNYPSDIGPVVAKAVWGLRQTGGSANDILALGEAYRVGSEAYDNDEAPKAEIDTINQTLYAGTDTELNEVRIAGINTSRESLATICAKLGTSFDAEIFESEVGSVGVEVVKKNLGSIFIESDGALVYPGEQVGLHTRVFVNSKGLPTYEAKDLGNFTKKNELFPNWSTSLVVTGNEQTEYFKVLFAALREVFAIPQNKNLEHIGTGFLTLTTGKMSSRKGNVLTGEALLEEIEAEARVKAAETRTDNLDELTEQVAVAALKYQILRQATGQNIIFDKEQALSFEGDSGPYLQYTHARIGSVLKKAEAEGLVGSIDLAPELPYEIERLIYQFPEVVAKALVERAPHKVTGFITELASAFNTFYASEKIADAADTYAPYKIALATAVKNTLKNGLWVLGIKAPEQM